MKAIRISIGNITYENVVILDPTYINPDSDIHNAIGDGTFIFKHSNRIHMTHVFNVNLIHLSRGKSKLSGIPFEIIVINGDKSYGPGRLITSKTLHNNNVITPLETFLEDHVMFECSEGIFITSNYGISNIQFTPDICMSGVKNMKSNVEQTMIDKSVKPNHHQQQH